MRPLAVGTCIVSTLDESDPAYRNRSRYEEYDLQLRQGEAVQIDMEALTGASAGAAAAYPFDTYLEIRRANEVEPLMVNDDRADSLNSRLMFTAPSDGHYTVTARAFGTGTGRFVLRAAAAARPETADEISEGRTSVALPPAGADATARVRAYYFEGRQNERVRFTIPNGPNPPSLELTNQAGGPVSIGWPINTEIIELVAVLPAGGRYYVRLSSAAAQLPSFDLMMERSTSSASAVPERIAPDVTVTRSLTINSPYDADSESFYQFYEVPTNGSKPVTITVEKLDQAFDPVVDVGLQSPLGFAAAASDDDGGGNFNARLVVPTPHPARLLIRVRSYHLATGRYRLTVTQETYSQRVFIHFAGAITRERIVELTGALRSTGWQVQGESGQRIPNAAGFNEVRYSAPADRAAAEALAASLTRAAVGAAPVTVRRLGIIQAGVLEVWISN